MDRLDLMLKAKEVGMDTETFDREMQGLLDAGIVVESKNECGEVTYSLTPAGLLTALVELGS